VRLDSTAELHVISVQLKYLLALRRGNTEVDSSARKWRYNVKVPVRWWA